MPKKRNDALMNSLALHVATGGTPKVWCAKQSISRRTADRWLALAEFKQLVRDRQKQIADRVLARHIGLLNRAMGVQRKLLTDESVNVRQRASEFLLTTLRQATELARLREEFDELRRELSPSQEGADDGRVVAP